MILNNSDCQLCGCNSQKYAIILNMRNVCYNRAPLYECVKCVFVGEKCSCCKQLLFVVDSKSLSHKSLACIQLLLIVEAFLKQEFYGGENASSFEVKNQSREEFYECFFLYQCSYLIFIQGLDLKCFFFFNFLINYYY